MTTTTLPLGEVKSHLSELVNRVHEHHERVTVTVHGRPSAVLLATEDLERLEETLAILRDSETVSRLATSDAELARVSWSQRRNWQQRCAAPQAGDWAGSGRSMHPADHSYLSGEP